jgi:PAS domain S-box-containing protein
MTPSSTFSRVALAVAAVLAVLLCLVLAAVPSAQQRHLLSNLAQTAMVVWAAICCFEVARRSDHYFCQLWQLLGAALSLAAAGLLLVTYYGSILSEPRSIPWPSDVLLFTWVAPAAMMLLPWRAEEGSLARWERILDFAQIGIVFVTAYLYFFYIPSLWEAQGMRMSSRLMQTVVARDVLLAGAFALRAATLSRSAARTFFGRLAAFFLFLGVVEAISISQWGELSRYAAWADASWGLPFIYLAAVAAVWSTPAEEQPEPGASDQSVWVVSQALPVGIPLLVIFMGRGIAREQITIAALAVAAAFACSAARLLLTSQKQRRIAEDLRRAEQAARRSEQLFIAAFRSSPDAISIARVPEVTFEEINDSFTRVTGFSREEALGKTAEDLGLWVDKEHMQALREQFRATGNIQDAEIRFRRKDGEFRFGQLSGVIITLDGRRYSLIVVSDITEKKQAEEATRKSEERFRSLVHSLRVGVTTWAPDGRLLFANDALLEMCGLEKEQLLGKMSPEILPAIGEDGSPIPPEMRPTARVIAMRRPFRNQVMGWLLPSTGRILWTLVDAEPEFAPDGELAGVIASITNITDLKRAEEEKRVSEEMFTKAFHSSPDSITISTLDDGRYVEVNEGFTRLFGWKREEAIGKTVAELGIWENLAGREVLKQKLLSQGRTSQYEAGLRIKSGEPRRVQISADVISLRGQTCILSVAHDITERKQREDALYASEERFRTLVQNLDVGVVLLGADGRFQFANSAAERIFGMLEAEVLGKKGSELDIVYFDENEKEIPHSERPVARVLRTGLPVRNVVLGWRRPTSTEISWIFGNAVPLVSKEGEITAVITSLADITEQKRAEEKLRRLSGRLLQLQDEERRRLGRDLHDSLAQSVLAVNLSLARVTQSSADLDERNRRALSEARAMLQDMSRQIRTLSYLLHPPLLDELGLASAVKEYAHGFSERSGIQVQVGVSPAFGRLPQEAETALFRIVQESLANIQRHSGSPSARIRLDGGPERITLEISDQGGGISEAKSKTLKQPGARFGVGIVGMHERMAQLGGSLEVESSKAGTTVRATLPVKSEVLDAVARPGGR